MIPNLCVFKTHKLGLESRRLDYEADKQNGTNHIEDLIKQGYYDKSKYSWIILFLVLFISFLILSARGTYLPYTHYLSYK
jgi:hypothetical protein